MNPWWTAQAARLRQQQLQEEAGIHRMLRRARRRPGRAGARTDPPPVVLDLTCLSDGPALAAQVGARLEGRARDRGLDPLFQEV